MEIVMSLKSVLAALNPFANAAETELDKVIAAIKNDAQAKIVKAQKDADAAKAAAALAAKRANFEQFVKDYQAYLASAPAPAPAPAPAAPTPAAPSAAG